MVGVYQQTEPVCRSQAFNNGEGISKWFPPYSLSGATVLEDVFIVYEDYV
jgi:hypothetical protein